LTISHPNLGDFPSIAANAGYITSNITASGDVKERAIKQCIFAGLAAALVTGGLIG
jgi:hypothetical protein